MLLAVDPKVLYYRHCPVFQATFAFFAGFLDRPGGPVEYLSLILAQSCWYPWLGALALLAALAFSYDLDNDAWGKPETVLSAADTHRSIALPRISPDGKFLLCCMADYGNFPAFSPTSDFYMLELATGVCRKLDISSNQSDAYHSWSSNSRWVVFSSKRLDGTFTRTFISYVDETGKASKPFLLPQEDPEFYDYYIRIYNLPELIREPVRLEPRDVARSLYDPAKAMAAKLDPRVKPPAHPTGPLPEPIGPGRSVE